MLYVRGNRLDYDSWNHAGNRGWAYDDVLPLFKRSEHNFFYDKTSVDKHYHGQTGPLNVVNTPRRSLAGEAFVRAAGECGFKSKPDLNWDFNGPEQVGAAGFYQLTNNPDGSRSSAASAFLRPAMSRPNLTILTEAFVHRVLWSSTQRVIGIEFRREGELHQAFADSEVILCAGTIMSPVLLMQSGIGPPENLRKFGIPTKIGAAGVGQNLQNHPPFLSS